MSNELYLQTSICKVSKELWDTLKKIHESDEIIKWSNFEKFRMKYNSFTMKMDKRPMNMLKEHLLVLVI